MVRTSGPALPSGRSAASTGQIVPSPVWSEQTRIRLLASWVAALSVPRLVALPRLGRRVREDHVDVGDVVELVAAALAHRDHREPGQAGVRADPLPGDRQRRLQGPGREVGQLGGGVVDAEVVGQVAGGEPQQPAPVLHAQRVDGLGVRQRRGRRGRVRVGADRAQQRGAHRPGRRPGRAQRRVGELAPVLGVPDQVVGRAPRSRRGRRAAASRCPRRRPAPPAARPGRRRTSVSRTSPAIASSGSAVRPSSASSGSAASPSRRERRPARRPGRGSRGADRLPVLVAGRVIAGRLLVLAGERREPGRQRPPGVVELGAGGVDVAQQPRRCRCRGSRASRGPTPPTAGARVRRPPGAAARPTSAARSGPPAPRRARSAASRVASAGSRVTTSSFHCTPRRGVASGPSSRSPGAASVQPTAEQADLLAARVALDACRRARPRSAGGPGRCRASAAGSREPPGPAPSPGRARRGRRRRWRPSGRRGSAARRTRRGSGSSSPAYGRRTSSSQPASLEPVAEQGGRALGVVLDDEDRGSLPRRSLLNTTKSMPTPPIAMIRPTQICTAGSASSSIRTPVAMRAAAGADVARGQHPEGEAGRGEQERRDDRERDRVRRVAADGGEHGEERDGGRRSASATQSSRLMPFARSALRTASAIKRPGACGRARGPRPGRGSRPTPRACCAGRSRRRARPACRRAARSARRSRSRRTGCLRQRLDAEARALALGQRPDVVLGLARQVVVLLDALHAGGQHDGERQVGVARGVDGAQLDPGRLALVAACTSAPGSSPSGCCGPSRRTTAPRRRTSAACSCSPTGW